MKMNKTTTINNIEEITDLIENYYFADFRTDYTKECNFIYNIIMDLQTIKKTQFEINGTNYNIEASTQEEANEIAKELFNILNNVLNSFAETINEMR